MFARTPKPPYYAVIFTSHQAHDEGYAETSARMEELGREQPGFLGIESVRGDDGLGITVSYWSDLESIRAWKAQSEHREAQPAAGKIVMSLSTSISAGEKETRGGSRETRGVAGCRLRRREWRRPQPRPSGLASRAPGRASRRPTDRRCQ